MTALILQTIKKQRNALISYLIISVLMLWMIVAIAPTFITRSYEISRFIENYPDTIKQVFGFDRLEIFSSLEGFISVEMFTFMWPIILIIAVTSFGSRTIAGEIDKGTIEILLAQPISRAKIFWSKYISGLMILLTFTVISIFPVIPLARLHNVDFVCKGYCIMSLLGFLYGIALFSLVMTVSSLFSSRGRTVSVTIGIIIVMYALNVLASLKESFGSLKYFSFFHYFDHYAALVKNHISFSAIIIFLSVSLICSLFGYMVFVKRNITT